MLRAINSFTVGMSWISPNHAAAQAPEFHLDVGIPSDKRPRPVRKVCDFTGSCPLLALDLEKMTTHLVFQARVGISKRTHHQHGVEFAGLDNAFFTLGWNGASLVARNRVQMFMPAAPIEARRRGARIPPYRLEATNGIFSSSAARGKRIMFEDVVLAGMNAAFEASDGGRRRSRIFSRFQRSRHRGAFVDTLMPAAFSGRHVLFGECGPAVSHRLTPTSLSRTMY